MRILLIDADSVIPNIPLMKISRYYKDNNDQVLFHKCNLPYYPNRKKIIYSVPNDFDRIYCSVVFGGNKNYIVGENIIFGGTGVDLTTVLPTKIEKCELDYSLYPGNTTSYGFITRGCIRNCYFCVVPQKEGYIHKVADIDDIVRHKKVKFLDNNILAYSKHISILDELVQRQIRCQFNQGLDIRLITKENSTLLSNLNYLGEYIFAFDSWSYKKIIEEKMSLLSWAKDWKLKFFVYVHPDMELGETVKRIKYLRKNKCLPYVMRDISCWDSEYNEFYIDVCAYCNQVHLFKTMSFVEFLYKRHKNKHRINKSLKIWNEYI